MNNLTITTIPDEQIIDNYPINCTGDVVAGDVIKFTEAVFGGSFRKPKYLGDRTIIAKVVKDSYGSAKQQHTFTIEVLSSSGEQPLEVGTITTRKGRNVYRNGTWRKAWASEEDRVKVAEEKHQRGDVARARRAKRMESSGDVFYA
jgi:hypothetical protein